MKITVITGGSQGIGLAIGKLLASQGHKVYLCARNQEPLTEAVKEIRALGHLAESCLLDVTWPKSVDSVFQTIYEQEGHLDILINSAGMSGFSELENDNDIQLWQKVLQTNLSGAYYCSRSAALKMKEHHWGRIVQIASTLGLEGMRNSYAYTASKHGLIGLTRGMALDVLDWGITVNAVCPGWVETPMGKSSMAKIAEHYGLPPQTFEEEEIRAVPIQRWIQPKEVAHMVAYLVSEESGAVTGKAFEISGGL